MLEYSANANGVSTTTAYTYDAANQLLTATKDSTVWNYTYDGNGSLILSTPGDEVANGAKRYSYNTAGFLVQVETYANDWQIQAEMAYDGLGNRLEMTGYADGQSLTTQYELDNGRVLSADAAGNVTYYLYGLGPIGELTTAWAYSLPDGGNTPRQLVNAAGEVTLTSSYTPWGDTLEVYGSGSFTQGYFGGVMDAATGLIYVGNGQYYDPETGRFLTRDARPSQNNPYTPVDPTSAMLAPLALLAMVFGRKKSRGKWDTLVILLVLSLSLGVGLAACGGSGETPTPDMDELTVVVTPGENIIVKNAAGTVIATAPLPNGTPTATPTSCPTVTIKLTRTPTSTPTFDPTSLPLPDMNDIPDLENWASSQVREKTINQYREMRKALYGQDNLYIESDGKIRDDVLVAQIIIAEFAVVKELYPQVYPELLEALSNQYDSGRKIGFSNPGNMRCYGKCTITTQIQWLYDIEGIRANSFVNDKVKSGKWASFLPDGQLAVEGYSSGTNSSWFWGNVTEDELCEYVITKQVYDPQLYGGKPYFIVRSAKLGSEGCK